MDVQEQPKAPAGTGGAERRKHPRFTVDEDASLLLVDHGLTVQCRVLDLSLEGCRMCSEEPLPEGIHVRVEATFQINGIPFRLAGLIQRTTQERDVGIRFMDLSQRRRAEWAEVLGEVKDVQQIQPEPVS